MTTTPTRRPRPDAPATGPAALRHVVPAGGVRRDPRRGRRDGRAGLTPSGRADRRRPRYHLNYSSPADPGYALIAANWDGQWYRLIAEVGLPAAPAARADRARGHEHVGVLPALPARRGAALAGLTGLPFTTVAPLLNLALGAVAVLLHVPAPAQDDQPVRRLGDHPADLHLHGRAGAAAGLHREPRAAAGLRRADPAAGPPVRRLRPGSPGAGADPAHRPGARARGGRALVGPAPGAERAPSPTAERWRVGLLVPWCVAVTGLWPLIAAVVTHDGHAYLQTMSAWKAYRHNTPVLSWLGYFWRGDGVAGLLLCARRARPARAGRTTARRPGLGHGGEDLGLGLPGVPVHRRSAGAEHHPVPAAGLPADVAIPGGGEASAPPRRSSGAPSSSWPLTGLAAAVGLDLRLRHHLAHPTPRPVPQLAGSSPAPRQSSRLEDVLAGISISCVVKARSRRDVAAEGQPPGQDRADPVAVAGQERDVDEQPGQPAQPSRRSRSGPADTHRPAAGDVGGRAQVAVPERLGRAAAPGHLPAGSGGRRRRRTASPPRPRPGSLSQAHQVADHEDLRVARDGQVGADRDPPGPVAARRRSPRPGRRPAPAPRRRPSTAPCRPRSASVRRPRPAPSARRGRRR